MKKLLFLFVFAAALTNVFGTPYYWVGGAGTSSAPKSWNSGSNWSTTSGNVSGTTGTVPGSGDIAIFDGSTSGPNSTNLSPFVDINGLTIALTGLQVTTITAANNVVAFVNNATSFTVSGDLTINKISTTNYGQISDYGVNTISVGGNINTNMSGSYALVTIPATNTSLSAGKIAMTGTNPKIQDLPTTAASVTATVTANKVTALTIVSGGSGYLAAPTVAFSGGGGTGAVATLTLTNGVVTGYSIGNQGSAYTSTPTVIVNYGSNVGFQNFDISGSTNLTFNTGNAFTINGNLNIQSGGKLTISKTLQFTSTLPTGSNPFNSPGTISGPGVIVGNTSWTFITQGSLPASYTTSNLQSIGTVYLDPTSATTSSINSLTQQRLNSTVTFAPAFLSSSVPTIAVGGSITLNGGVINDGGNTITVSGGTTIVTTNTTADAAVLTGTGRIKINRSTTAPVVSAGKTVTLNNLEIGGGSGAVAFTVGSGTNLTINGKFTISKAGSSLNLIGSTVTFQNADVPIFLNAVGTITTDATTNLNFGSAGNTGGAAFAIPSSAFTTAPTLGTFTINRDNALTFNNQALTVSGATTITAGTLAMATTLTTNGGATVNGTFQLNAGGWATGGTWTYGGSGTLAFNNTAAYGVNNTDVFWPTTNGPVNVNVKQGGGSPSYGLNLNSASRTVTGLFQTASGVKATSSTLTLNGTAQINAGGFFDGTCVPTYGASSTLKYNTGTVYGRADEWSTTSPASVQISNNTTLDYPKGFVVAAKSLTGNLTVDAGSSFYMDYGSVGQSNPLSIGGNVLLNGNLGLGGAIGGDLNVGGSWTRGVSANLYPNSRAVFFNGTGDQTISHTGGEVFDYMGVNKASGTLSSADSIVVNNTLFLTSGKITLGANNLIIGASGTISGASSASYIVTDGVGKFKQTVGASTATLFPIGISTSSYDPATLTPTTGTLISASVSGSISHTAPVTSYYDPREWTITPDAASSTTVTLTPSVLTGSLATYNVVGRYITDTWFNFPATMSNSYSTYTVTTSTFAPAFVTGATDITTQLGKETLSKSGIYATNGNIYVENANGKAIEIYSLTGRKVYSATGSSDKASVATAKGIYLVSVGNLKTKVVVR